MVDFTKTELEMISFQLLSVCSFPPSITDGNFLFQIWDFLIFTPTFFFFFTTL